MKLELDDKRVVVTAGGSGIGMAIAKRFQEEGATVSICDISGDAVDAACQQGFHAGVADVGDPDSVASYFEQVRDELGNVDVLVNNAGIGGPTAALEDVSVVDWDDVIRINLSGMFYCLREVTPHMKSAGDGCVVNISTVNARIGLPMRLPYVTSKAGVLGLTYNVARELGPFGIRCNAILPGPIDNARGRALIEKQAQSKGCSVQDATDDFLKYSSLRTLIDAKEIGDTAVFLASRQGRHITGQSIGVCGNLEWEE